MYGISVTRLLRERQNETFGHCTNRGLVFTSITSSGSSMYIKFVSNGAGRCIEFSSISEFRRNGVRTRNALPVSMPGTNIRCMRVVTRSRIPIGEGVNEGAVKYVLGAMRKEEYVTILPSYGLGWANCAVVFSDYSYTFLVSYSGLA